MSDYRPKEGDHIKVTLSGEVVWVSASKSEPPYFTVDTGSNEVTLNTEDDIEIVVDAKPKYKVFEPGDVVRHKDSGSDYIVGDGGCLAKSDYRWYPLEYELTSEHYGKAE